MTDNPTDEERDAAARAEAVRLMLAAARSDFETFADVMLGTDDLIGTTWCLASFALELVRPHVPIDPELLLADLAGDFDNPTTN